MVTVKVIGLSELNKLSEQLTEVKPDVKKIVKEYGVYAKNIAPKSSGALRQGIRWFSTENKGTIRSGLPNHKDNRNRPYHAWMHGYSFVKGPDGKGYDLSKGWRNWKTGKMSYIKSGVPNYMEVTAEKLSKDIDNKIINKLNKL